MKRVMYVPDNGGDVVSRNGVLVSRGDIFLGDDDERDLEG
jgi:hypothetical protein